MGTHHAVLCTGDQRKPLHSCTSGEKCQAVTSWSPTLMQSRSSQITTATMLLHLSSHSVVARPPNSLVLKLPPGLHLRIQETYWIYIPARNRLNLGARRRKCNEIWKHCHPLKSSSHSIANPPCYSTILPFRYCSCGTTHSGLRLPLRHSTRDQARHAMVWSSYT